MELRIYTGTPEEIAKLLQATDRSLELTNELKVEYDPKTGFGSITPQKK